MKENWNKLLLESIKNNNLEKVRLSLINGADVHMAQENMIDKALELGNLDIVKCLLEFGADRQRLFHTENFPLRWSCNQGYIELAKYLVDQGADITTRDFSCLKWTDDGKILIWLVDYILNSDINSDDMIGYLPDVQELKDTFPWLYAARDHDL